MLTTGLLLLFETAFDYLLHILEDYQVAFQYTFLTFSKQIILHFWTKSKHFRCKFKLFYLSCSLACTLRLYSLLIIYRVGVHAQFCNRGWSNGHYKKWCWVGKVVWKSVMIAEKVAWKSVGYRTKCGVKRVDLVKYPVTLRKKLRK